METMFDCSLAKSCRGGFECCGIFPIAKSIVITHKYDNKYFVRQTEFEGVIVIETTDCNCIYMNRENGKCTIYHDRPKLCRDYGKIDKLPCPYIDTNGNVRSRAERRNIQRRIELSVKQGIDKFKIQAKALGKNRHWESFKSVVDTPK